MICSLNGDYNPLHASPEAGKALGYGGIIMHGLFSWNVAAQTVLEHYGNGNGANFRDFEAKFMAPVKPGDRLEIRMWDLGKFNGEIEELEDKREKLKEIRFQVTVKGKVVLGDGRALLSHAIVAGTAFSANTSSNL